MGVFCNEPPVAGILAYLGLGLSMKWSVACSLVCVVKWVLDAVGSQFGSCHFYRYCFERGGSQTFAMLFRESDYVLRCWLLIL